MHLQWHRASSVTPAVRFKKLSSNATRTEQPKYRTVTTRSWSRVQSTWETILVQATMQWTGRAMHSHISCSFLGSLCKGEKCFLPVIDVFQDHLHSIMDRALNLHRTNRSDVEELCQDTGTPVPLVERRVFTPSSGGGQGEYLVTPFFCKLCRKSSQKARKRCSWHGGWVVCCRDNHLWFIRV